MSDIRARAITLATIADGTGNVSARLAGKVHALALRLGTLDTPDLTVTDGLTGAPILAVAGVAADTRWQPRVPVQDDEGVDISGAVDAPAVTGRLDVAIAGGGDTKAGTLIIVFEA